MAETGKLRALVVEDDREMAHQLKRILEKKFPLVVETVYDCASARRSVSAKRFDIITLDFMLPDGRGLDLLEEMTVEDGSTRVIMVTGHGDEETAVRSFRSRASGYVVKDEHLRSRLEDAVEKAFMEISLRQAEEELRRRERHFRSLIEKASDLITVMSTDGVITYESPSIERILGYKPVDIIGKNAFEFIHPDDVPRIKKLADDVLATPGMTAIAEYRLRHKNGPYLTFESIARNLLGDPAVQGLVINSRDITERKFNEERLRRYREQLEQLVDERTAKLADTNVQLQQEIAERRQAQAELLEKAERLADFLTVASHELRHPISVVKGYATMLEGYLEKMEPDDLRQILDALDTSVDRLTRYVEELMEVSLVEQGRFTFHRVESEVPPLVQTAVSDMKARGMDNDVTLRVADDAGGGFVDPEKFVQLMVILLENAVKFSPPSSELEIEIARLGSETVVSVMDRGIGVPAGSRELIFDRFYQVEDVKHHSSVGLGLGLYLAREIVGAHGGSITHEPRDGGGSIFRFTMTDSDDDANG